MVNFVLEYFNNTFTIDQCGQLLGFAPEQLDFSATAIYEVSRDVFRDVFRYWTDASDVDTTTDASDVRYYVKMENWPATYIINPAHARMQVNDAQGHNSSGEIATGFDNNRALVKHDFLRYISQKLFNTHLGVDLFTNESDMTFNIAKQGDLSGWGKIYEVLSDASNGGGVGYYTNEQDGSNNITRQLLSQLIYDASGRERLFDISSDVYPDGTYPIPFENGDSVSFTVTINPAAGQNDLTGVAAFGGRTYKIKLVISDDDSNVAPGDNKLQEGQLDLSGSYVHQ